MELIEDELSLKQAQFYNMICLYLQFGTPSKYGQKRLMFYLANYQKKEDYNGYDNVFYKFSLMFEMPVRTLDTTIEVKKLLVEKINELYPDMKVTLDRLRLREKSAEKLLQIYHD